MQAENSHLGDTLILFQLSRMGITIHPSKKSRFAWNKLDKKSYWICGLLKGSSDPCSKRILTGASMDLVNFMILVPTLTF